MNTQTHNIVSSFLRNISCDVYSNHFSELSESPPTATTPMFHITFSQPPHVQNLMLAAMWRRTVVQMPAQVLVRLAGLHHEAGESEHVQQPAETFPGQNAACPLLLQHTLDIAEQSTDLETHGHTSETHRATLETNESGNPLTP